MSRSRSTGLRIALAVAAVVRLLACIWAWNRVPPTADGAFYHVVAQRIASGAGYSWLWPDGVVTPAAHYPVGYPSAMAPLYALGGPVPGLAMCLNALLGIAAVWAVYTVVHTLIDRSRWPMVAGRAATTVALALALSPTLILYTPALMTEGAVAALLLVAMAVVVRGTHEAAAHSRPRGAVLVVLAVLVAGATYLRPQSILFAPVFGLFLDRKTWLRTFGGGVLCGALSVALVLPWTFRNCERMERCVFVSANGGWNLLIGTFPEGGGSWVALEGDRVPEECRTVYQEAAKDGCFGQAGQKRIQADLSGWLTLVPAKLRATADHTAFATAHLLEAGAIEEPLAQPLRVAEVLWQRALALLALLGAVASSWHRNRRARWWLLPVALLAGVGFAGAGAWWAWLLCVGLYGAQIRRAEPVATIGGFALISTLGVHAVFFGAGRYFLPAMLLAAPLSGLGVAYIFAQLQERQRAMS